MTVGASTACVGTRTVGTPPDLVEAIRNDQVDHEIATHSYGHVYFGESSAEAVSEDLMRARAVHETHGLPFRSLVFPRNQVAHLDVVAQAGIEMFRSVDAGILEAVSRRAPQLRPLVNLADKALPFAPPVVQPVRHDHGLIELPSSLLLIGRNGLRRVVSTCGPPCQTAGWADPCNGNRCAVPSVVPSFQLLHRPREPADVLDGAVGQSS